MFLHKKYILFLLLFSVILKTKAQSSIIEPSNLQLPNLSSTQIQAIELPQKGMMVFDKDVKTLRYFDGNAWVSNNTQNTNFDGQNLTLFQGSATNHDILYDLKSDSVGNVYVLNAYKGTVTYGAFSTTNPEVNYYHFCVVKFNPDGQALWLKNLAGDVPSFAVDASGNVYLNISNDLKKYDTDGNLLFTVMLPTPIVQKITVAPNGNIYAIIRTDYPFIKDGVQIGCENTIENFGGGRGILCFNSTGVVQWERGICDSFQFLITTIFTDEQSDIYLSGTHNFTSVDLSEGTNLNGILPNSTYQRSFMGKYDKNGVFQWVKVVANNNSSTANTIRQLIPTKFSSNNLFLSVGYSSNDLYYDNALINSTNPCLNATTENTINSSNAAEFRINATTGELLSSQQDFGGEIAVSSSNNYYHINAYPCPLSDAICSVKFPNKVIAKRTSLGEISWATKTNADLKAIAKGANKTVWIGGTFSTNTLSFGRTSLTTNQPFSMFLLRIKE
jgi:hypothetical protein